MHRFLVAPEQLDGERVRFSDAQAHQLRSVLRLRAGEQVRVFDGARPIDSVVELTDTREGRVVSEAAQPPEPRTRLTVHPALVQRDKFEGVLQKLTEIGVAAIEPVLAARCVVREPPDERRSTRWRAILREAAEQSGRGAIPRLLPPRPLVDALTHAAGRVVFAYEAERRGQVRDAVADHPHTVALFVGPEGGYTLDEVACARQAGARVVSLGPRVLRTETASPLAAALVLYELGDLSWPADVHDHDHERS